MTLTPEQFNKLATKDGIKDLKNDFSGNFITKNEFSETMEIIIKKLKNLERISICT